VPIEGTLDRAEAVAVTVEPAGGSPEPKSDILLTSTLSRNFPGVFFPSSGVYGSHAMGRRPSGKVTKGASMTVARVTELSATSDQSFEDAVNIGVKRATSTLRNVESAWVKDQNVMIENGNIVGYKVNIAITFVLEEGEQP
jgi:dodecin